MPINAAVTPGRVAHHATAACDSVAPASASGLTLKLCTSRREALSISTREARAGRAHQAA